jgi:hypothetical protein
LKEQHLKNSIKKNKIAHIFNIRSINLIEKLKYDKDKIDNNKAKLKRKYSSKEKIRNLIEKS